MKILFDNVENQEGTIYVSLDDGASYNQYELKNVWATGIEIPDDTDFSKVKIKARAEIFKNLFVVSGMKTLATYKIDFDIEKEMISYYKKTEVDSKLSSLTSSVNTSIDNINNTLNKSVLNVKQSDEAGYITVLYNNGESNKVVVGSPTDTALSSTSTNPVQNKVVNAALEAIKSSITTAVNNTIAQIVAESPEDFDTLKEIAAWIDTHEDSASAMNSAIQTNKTAIATEISNRKSADTALQTNIDKKVDFLIVSTNKTIAAGNYNAVLIIATSDLKLTYPNTSGTSTTQALTAGSMTILAKSNSGYTNSIFGAVYN